MVETKSELSQEIQDKLVLEELTYTDESLFDSYNGIYNQFVKRVIDFTLALIGILIVLPFLLIISVAVALETGFPILYRPLRGGYKNKAFHICKFRTMVKDADRIGGGTTALNDSRITKVGSFLRKTKLDEIPQLLNVLCGNMSFVGPRPELLQYTDNYSDLEKNILNVRPGITDFSSINFISLDEIVGGEDADEMYERFVLEKKNQLRLKYVAEVSFATDFKIFFDTVMHVINKFFAVLWRK